jgi:hypothetical protein
VNKTIKDLSILALTCLSLALLIWLPHQLRLPLFNLDFSNGFATIYRNYDGLEYVTIAKSFYSGIPIYYASHFPFYPFLMSLVAPIFGFLKPMLFISLLFTIFSSWMFYKLVKDFKLSNHPLWLSVLFLLLPARWVIVHSVGSPEPIFIFFVLASIYSFLKFEHSSLQKWIWYSAIFGLLAQLTRPPGVLLFASFVLYILWSVRKTPLKALKYYPLSLIPLGLLGIFYLYGVNYGDFFAYFHSGDNIHLTLPPYQIFNINQYWVGDIWLEDVIYIFLIGFAGGLMLLKQRLYPLAFFVLTYLFASVLIAHRDISRYTLPVMPFILIAFEKALTSREFKIVMVILSLGIYLYAQNFIIKNTAPIPDLSVFN